MQLVHGMNEIVLFLFRTYPIKRSKIIKITITNLNKLKLELQSGKIEIKLELLSSNKKITLKLQFKKYLKLQKHWSRVNNFRRVCRLESVRAAVNHVRVVWNSAETQL